MISVVSGLALQAPIIATRLLPAEPPGMVVHIFGAMAVFIGVMLAFSARDAGKKQPKRTRTLHGKVRYCASRMSWGGIAPRGTPCRFELAMN